MILPLHPHLSPLGQRRAFSPLQIAGLRLWLRADAITGLADGAAVASWPDDSGNGKTATQSTGANQPTFRTNVVNGRPVVRFDGTNDWMSVAALALPGAFTGFYVFRCTAGLLAEHSAGAGSNDGDYLYPPGGAHTLARRGGGTPASSAYDVSTNLADNAWRVVTRRLDGTHAGHALYLNGTLQAKGTVYTSADPGTATVTDTYYLGARNGASLFLAGDLAELLLYDTALPAASRQAVESFLAAKYGL